MLRQPLSRIQAVVGITAGVISIVGAFYSVKYGVAPRVREGQIVAIVQDARSHRPVTDATVEIYTAKDAIVTTLTPKQQGRIRHTVREGNYKLRVSHPRFLAEIRPVQVQAGQVSEVRLALAPRPVPVTNSKPAAKSESSGSTIKKFFRKLGFD